MPRQTRNNLVSAIPGLAVRLRLSLILFFGVSGGSVIVAHFTGSVFLTLSIPALLNAILIIYVSSISDSKHLTTTLVAFLGTCYTLGIVGVSPTLIGADTDLFAIWITQVSQTNELTHVGSGFYKSVPIFLLLSSIAATLFGIHTDQALLIYPVIMGVFIPTAIRAISLVSFPSISNALLSRILVIGALATQTVAYTVQPIAQVTGILIWVAILLLLTRYLESGRVRFLICLSILMGASIFTHKMTAFVILLLLLSILLLIPIKYSYPFFRKQTSTLFVLLTITSVLLYLQWFKQTSYGYRALIQTIDIVSGSISSPVSTVNPEVKSSLARPVNPPHLAVIRYGLSIISLLTLGGFAWVWHLRNHRNLSIDILLAGTMIPVALSIISAVAGKLNPQRFHALSEPLLAILIPVWLINRFGLQAVSNLILVLLIIFQIFSGAVIPDYPGVQKSYLDEEEIAGWHFVDDYGDGMVLAQYTFMIQTPNERIRQGNLRGRPNIFKRFPADILDQHVSLSNSCGIVSGSLSAHKMEGGYWFLTYTLSDVFERSEHSVYTSGKVRIFC